jgi:hypothetical protein
VDVAGSPWNSGGEGPIVVGMRQKVQWYLDEGLAATRAQR